MPTQWIKARAQQRQLALAAKQLQIAQMQRNAQSKEEVWQLQNQRNAIQQITGLKEGQKISEQSLNDLASQQTQQKKWAAEAQAQFNQLVHDGVAPEQARLQVIQQYNLNVDQANQAAMQSCKALQLQLQAASAITGEQQIKVQYEQTYNKLLGEGVDKTLAQAVAMKEMEVSVAKASASVMKQVKSLNDSTEMIIAQKNGTEATTAAAIAYRNAIESGANETSAAALSAATLANYMAKAADGASTFSMFIMKASTIRGALGVALYPGGAPGPDPSLGQGFGGGTMLGSSLRGDLMAQLWAVATNRSNRTDADWRGVEGGVRWAAAVSGQYQEF